MGLGSGYYQGQKELSTFNGCSVGWSFTIFLFSRKFLLPWRLISLANCFTHTFTHSHCLGSTLSDNWLPGSTKGQTSRFNSCHIFLGISSLNSLVSNKGFPGGSVMRNLPDNAGAARDKVVRKFPWRRKWKPTPVFLPGESHRQRSLAGYSLWSHKEPDTD